METKKVAAEGNCHVPLHALNGMEENELVEDIEGSDEVRPHHRGAMVD